MKAEIYVSNRCLLDALITMTYKLEKEVAEIKELDKKTGAKSDLEGIEERIKEVRRKIKSFESEGVSDEPYKFRTIHSD